MVAVRDLSVAFGDLQVLSEVNLTVERGTFVGLVGPNGAGKTTLLRALRGTLTPDSGSVELAGDRVADLSARETGRRVASVPQDTSLSFDFPVRNVVEMGRTPHLPRFGGHDAEDDEAVREAMERAEVTEFADRPITTVSGGERQRVLLARALAQDAPTLLLDEPTASLDVNHAVRTLGLVRRLVEEADKTAVAAIHDLDMAARYCDELVVVADGGIHAAGPPAEVLSRATLRSAFDAETFVGRNPVTGAPSVTALEASGVEASEEAPGHDESSDGSPADPPTDPPRVHVVGTGSKTGQVVGRLAAAGHGLSVGVVPEGDTAATVATDADATVVTVPAFAGVDEEAAARATRLAREADATVVVGDPAAGNREVVDAGEPVVDISVPEEAVAAVREALESDGPSGAGID